MRHAYFILRIAIGCRSCQKARVVLRGGEPRGTLGSRDTVLNHECFKTSKVRLGTRESRIKVGQQRLTQPWVQTAVQARRRQAKQNNRKEKHELKLQSPYSIGIASRTR
ncbi:hypothetical protein O6H91_14G025500 [Diphasiastrum complanatum]|uniref:Uncharacterized protein n=1 Tax=Diphasiastrum complanatum TaxID=34168 RepID=A0ACC2BME9_DIPCM|nr:hypothetical protein O6H91_14G025500 [Diphasiastrum complanatum]